MSWTHSHQQSRMLNLNILCIETDSDMHQVSQESQEKGNKILFRPAPVIPQLLCRSRICSRIFWVSLQEGKGWGKYIHIISSSCSNGDKKFQNILGPSSDQQLLESVIFFISIGFSIKNMRYNGWKNFQGNITSQRSQPHRYPDNWLVTMMITFCPQLARVPVITID